MSITNQTQDSGSSYSVIFSPGLQFDGLHPCNPRNYMDYYTDYNSFIERGGMEG